MDNNRLPAAGGLRKKLFLLCSLLVIIASMAFALIGILQLRASARVAAETNESQNKAIKERSQETISSLTYEDMLNTITLAAKNADGEFWTMKHDFTMLAVQVQDIFEHPEKYGEREVNPPDPEKAGQYSLQLIFANKEAANDPVTLGMGGFSGAVFPDDTKIIAGLHRKRQVFQHGPSFVSEPEMITGQLSHPDSSVSSVLLSAQSGFLP